MSGTPCALVVTGDLDLAGRWMASLRGAGYTTVGCVGPPRSFECPRAAGRRCPLADVADLLVVDRAADPEGLCAGSRTPALRLSGGRAGYTDRRVLLRRLSIAVAASEAEEPWTEGPLGAETNDRGQSLLPGRR